jgi:transcriptional regulator with XRE-family HTH domain
VSGVGARLRALRIEAELSQAEVGAPYYTRAYVSAVELEKVQPSLKALAHFASRLGVSAGALAP